MTDADRTDTSQADAIVSQANAVCGIYGISGVGKTSLAVTAIEEAWETYGARTHYYSSDLGGWGNKLLSLIKLGIADAWYIRNHINAFETMELASMGYWPETMLDRNTGLAAPDVRLVPPQRIVFAVVCPNGHVVARFADQAQVQQSQTACPECGVLTNVGNALRIDKSRIRSKGFKGVGHRVYDSLTQLCEYGMQVLKEESAAGRIGDVLGSANALQSGNLKFGTSSKSQFGFMQDRVPVWIANIRAIPDQVLPPVATFGVELSKGDDESGGNPVYGPKISGNARTSSVPGWLGNCLYACKEPDDDGVMRHALWLVNRVDPRDSRAIPYMAKHRGEPLGMPPVLMDSGLAKEAWDICSLRVFYKLLREQAIAIEARDRAKYANAPALTAADEEAGEEVIETVQQTGTVATGDQPSMLPVSGRVIRRPGRRPGAAVVSAPPVQPPSPPIAATAPPPPQESSTVEPQAPVAVTTESPVVSSEAGPAAAVVSGGGLPTAEPVAAAQTAAQAPAVGGGPRRLRRPSPVVTGAIVPVPAPAATAPVTEPLSPVAKQLQASLQAATQAATVPAAAPVVAAPPATAAPAPLPVRVTDSSAPPVVAGTGHKVIRRPRAPQ